MLPGEPYDSASVASAPELNMRGSHFRFAGVDVVLDDGPLEWGDAAE
jgi:hypothetical protein